MTHRDAVAAAADAQAGLVADYDAVVAELAATKQALADCQAAGGSGATITTDVPSGWKESVREDFLTPCLEGQFAGVYPAATSRISYYPRGYYDTRRKQGRGGGEYSADYVSVSGSILTARMFVNASGVTQCNALVPLAVPLAGKWGDAPGMIYEHRSRFTYSDGLKSAHLLWPITNTSLPDGEIDYPEFQAAQSVECYVHHQGATTGSDQKQLVPSGVAIDPRQWHTYRLRWVMGQSVTIYCDGAQVATYATRIPAKPMHLVLQNESWLDTRPVPPDASGTMETDWVRVLIPA